MTDSKKRPLVWVGHIAMDTDRLDESEFFMLQLGMRPIAKEEDYAILELRGGTHLILSRKDKITPDQVSFDLMVEQLSKNPSQAGCVGFVAEFYSEGPSP